MRKKGDTARHSAAEIAALRRRGASRTDWRKVDAMSEAELDAAVAADADDVPGALDWTRAVKGVPPPKQAVKLRIDADVLTWFRATGKGYQTRMNNVLRAFVENRKGGGR
ncbi:MAG: BrnA antitoxin family protein [Rhodospirillales bacterium]